MPYDDPTRPRTRPRPDKKPSLLDTLIPEPDHPLAMRRTLSVGVLTTFILLFLYECVAAAPTYDGAGGRVTRWMWGQSVSWGREVAAGGQLVVGPASQQYGIEDESDTTASAVVGASGTASSQSTPDWQRYVWHEDLKWKEGNGRLIVLGDIHGMVDSMQSLLSTLNTTEEDTVVLIGDLVAKHPSISHSLATVRYARKQGFQAVRGNHDQDVIAWRNWMEDHRKWLKRQAGVVDDGTDDEDEDEDATMEGEAWLDADEPPVSVTSEEAEERFRIPKGWIWKSQHFEIARRMPQKDFDWLLKKSLTLHVRSMHMYFVHAGMLPWERPLSGRPKSLSAEALATSTDPHYFSPPLDSELSASKSSSDPDDDLDSDVSILEVKENRDPFTLLNVRGLKKGRKVTKNGKKGTPWYNVWNKTMKFCAKARRQRRRVPARARPDVYSAVEDAADEPGTDTDDASETEDDAEVDIEAKKSCRPLGIVYGHWAAKDLTVNPYSIGLDSGCVYGRSLSALVIGEASLASATNTTDALRARQDDGDDEDGDSVAAEGDEDYQDEDDEEAEEEDDEDEDDAEFEEMSGKGGLRRRKVKIQGRRASIYNIPCPKP